MIAEAEQILAALEPRIRQIVRDEMKALGAANTAPGNTFAEAAQKLGVSLRTVKSYVASRVIDFIEISERKKFITDSAIEQYKAKRTRKSIFGP